MSNESNDESSVEVKQTDKKKCSTCQNLFDFYKEKRLCDLILIASDDNTQ